MIESVELGEASCLDDFSHYETMISVVGPQEKKDGDEHRRSKDRKKEVFWCKGYQRKSCTEKSPHMVVIKGDEPPVPVLHICANCLQKDNRREEHPECECMAKKQ